MAKEIKFRVYNKNAKDYIRDEDKNIRIFDLWSWSIYVSAWGIKKNDYNYVFQEFILSLNDDTDIYEGDIVSWYDKQGYFDIAPEADIMVVEWNEGDCKFFCRSLTDGSKYDAGDCRIDMVDGNIFENPDLLKL